MLVIITIFAVLVALIAVGVMHQTLDDFDKLSRAVDPDVDIFATLLVRRWSLYYRGGHWSVGDETGDTPEEAWRRATAVWDARHAEKQTNVC
jgi:hypothetical protein